jgi:hypothetical protein
MTDDITADRIRDLIDKELIEGTDQVPDASAEYNFAIEMSGLVLHIIKRRPGGPLQVGQEIEFDNEITSQIRQMPDSQRDRLVAQIREALMETPIIYGFQDADGANVRFREMDRIFIERRLYGSVDQQTLMDALIAVWQALRYLDDIWRFIEASGSG